jgi:hypothetical protein
MLKHHWSAVAGPPSTTLVAVIIANWIIPAGFSVAALAGESRFM